MKINEFHYGLVMRHLIVKKRSNELSAANVAESWRR